MALTLENVVALSQPAVQWATVAGSQINDYPYDITLAPAGQVYVVGSFEQVSGADRFGWPTKTFYRFDANGMLLESQSSRGEFLRGVAVDSQGTYYVTGQVWDSQRLGVGLTNDFYLARYSPAGALVWERTGGTLTYSRMYPYNLGGFRVALDGSGNIYAVGGSTGPAIFGSVTFPNTVGGPLLCKYGPDGSLVWARRIESSPTASAGIGTARSIALDPEGNVLIGGYLDNGPTDFGGLIVTIAGPYSGYFFIAKYNPNGNVLWARQSHADHVAVDQRGDVYGIGNVISSDPKATTGMFCGKFDAAGNAVWERIVPGAYGNGISLDRNSEPVFAGEFSGVIDLDGMQLQSTGSSFQDLLICKADAGGHFQWALSGGGAEFERATQVICDGAGSCYLTGVIRKEPGMFGSFPLDPLVPGDPTTDVFLSRVTDPTAVAVVLGIARTASDLTLSWPVEATNFVLEATTSLPAVSWTTVTNTLTVTATERSVQLPLTGNAQFFRLRQP